MTEEEKRIRSYEVRIENINREKEIKMKQMMKEQKKRKRKKAKRLQQMKAAPALEGSQEMEFDSSQ